MNLLINKSNYKWYIFYCKSRAEKKAYDTLIKYNFEVYLPLIAELKKWSDRVKKVQTPMFRGYIFVYSKREDLTKVLQASTQIVAPVKIGNEFACLKDKEIEFLKLLEKNDMKVVVQPKKIGRQSKIKIVNGPFVGYEGTCIEELGSNYFLVEIEALNQEIKLNIHESWID